MPCLSSSSSLFVRPKIESNNNKYIDINLAKINQPHSTFCWKKLHIKYVAVLTWFFQKLLEKKKKTKIGIVIGRYQSVSQTEQGSQ